MKNSILLVLIATALHGPACIASDSFNQYTVELLYGGTFISGLRELMGPVDVGQDNIYKPTYEQIRAAQDYLRINSKEYEKGLRAVPFTFGYTNDGQSYEISNAKRLPPVHYVESSQNMLHHLLKLPAELSVNTENGRAAIWMLAAQSELKLTSAPNATIKNLNLLNSRISQLLVQEGACEYREWLNKFIVNVDTKSCILKRFRNRAIATQQLLRNFYTRTSANGDGRRVRRTPWGIDLTALTHEGTTTWASVANDEFPKGIWITADKPLGGMTLRNSELNASTPSATIDFMQTRYIIDLRASENAASVQDSGLIRMLRRPDYKNLVEGLGNNVNYSSVTSEFAEIDKIAEFIVQSTNSSDMDEALISIIDRSSQDARLAKIMPEAEVNAYFELSDNLSLIEEKLRTCDQ